MTDAAPPLQEGSRAPGFTLPGRSGHDVSLSEFEGKNDVLVYFYPKDDTPGCTKEACSLRDAWKELQDAGVVVLGISRDDAASHNKFAAKYNLPFELLTDKDHAVHAAYGAWGFRALFGIGTLRKSFLIGKDGTIRRVFDKVDTSGHAKQVLTAIGAWPDGAATAAVAPAPTPPPAPKTKVKAKAKPKAKAKARTKVKARTTAKPAPKRSTASRKAAGTKRAAAPKRKPAARRKAATSVRGPAAPRSARKSARRAPPARGGRRKGGR